MCSSRAISLIDRPRTRYSRRTRAIVSTPFIPHPTHPDTRTGSVRATRDRGSILDADPAAQGVNIPRRSTEIGLLAGSPGWLGKGVGVGAGENDVSDPIAEARADLGAHLGTTLILDDVVKESTAFVIFMLVLGLDMISAAKEDPLYWHIRLAMVVFLVLFLILSVALLLIGSLNARKVKGLLA